MASIFFMAFSFPADPPHTGPADRQIDRAKGRNPASSADGTEPAVALPMPAIGGREIPLFSFCCTIASRLGEVCSNNDE
jgi:hypothetical protein